MLFIVWEKQTFSFPPPSSWRSNRQLSNCRCPNTPALHLTFSVIFVSHVVNVKLYTLYIIKSPTMNNSEPMSHLHASADKRNCLLGLNRCAHLENNTVVSVKDR